MMALTLEEFQAKFEIVYEQMTIEEGVSIYPRTILVPKCPECAKNLFLYHSVKKPDPFIAYKVNGGVLAEKHIGPDQWVLTCWTDNCDFLLLFDESELAICPECGRLALELYSLYDHMRFQCTRNAQKRETLIKAGVRMYIGELM